MLYFVKRNQKLSEFKNYYNSLVKICAALNSLNPDLEKCKSLLLFKDKKIKISLGTYLEVNHKFKLNEFLNLNVTDVDKDENLNSIKILKKNLNYFNAILQKLKSYESFQARIKFGQFEKLFNFENYIYEDKQFKYSTISNYNKRIIPEFVSAAFALMVYQGDVADKIRRNMEQYFVAILSNMDYQNFAHVAQINAEFEKKLSNEHNLFYVLGTAPLTFDDSEYVMLMNERISTAEKFIKKLVGKPIAPRKIWQRRLSHQYTTKIKIDEFFFDGHWDYTLLGKDGGVSKLTFQNLQKIFKDIEDTNTPSQYNLFIFTSTFHIIKTAIEIEKYFYNKVDSAPSNIILVGDESFYTLAHNKDNCHKRPDALYHKKKLKSFMYELFMHTLDKNAVKETSS